jgi:hypothetical protein
MSHLWAQVLGIRPVNLDDDFFALGGNSLLAAEMLARARVMFGIDARQVRPLTRCLLRDPTLGSFSAAAQDARAGTLSTDSVDTRVDYAREAALDVLIRRDAGPPPRWAQPTDILLTGATGFFGVHLLRELLATTSARVHCLVRAHNAGHGRERIAQAAARYELGRLPLGRVIALAGDLAAPDLGLPPDTFDELARRVDVIHHAAAPGSGTSPRRRRSLMPSIFPWVTWRATSSPRKCCGTPRGRDCQWPSTGLSTLSATGAAGCGTHPQKCVP